jgi:hypothetical protein
MVLYCGKQGTHFKAAIWHFVMCVNKRTYQICLFWLIAQNALGHMACLKKIELTLHWQTEKYWDLQLLFFETRRTSTWQDSYVSWELKRSEGEVPSKSNKKTRWTTLDWIVFPKIVPISRYKDAITFSMYNFSWEFRALRKRTISTKDASASD